MIRRKGLIYGLCAMLAVAAPLAADSDPADDASQQTIVVRDGRVLTLDGDTFVIGKRAFLGVGLVDITPELREHFGAPKDHGILIGSVESASPAEKAGVRVGDIIVSLDGKDLSNSVDLRRGLRDKKGGDAVRLEVLRGKSRHALVATVVERDPVFPKIKTEELEKMQQKINDMVKNPEWKARIEASSSLGQLQARIKELEIKLKELEKKLQK
ncbi:MAG: PDZ domain-containing protein [Thermoanaerobaculia bacterium]